MNPWFENFFPLYLVNSLFSDYSVLVQFVHISMLFQLILLFIFLGYQNFGDLLHLATSLWRQNC